ncbi:MAG: hypothetical protein GY711_34020 [bacterium]|nr:hypothetical protein [bacterium]
MQGPLAGLRWLSRAIVVGATTIVAAMSPAQERPHLVFCCSADNDLYRVVTTGGAAWPRHDRAIDGVRAAPEGAGVLILADDYPASTTTLEPAVFELAAEKGLRLYVEYPGALPDIEVSAPRRTHLERAVVASDVFGEVLAEHRILAIHDCHFVGAASDHPHLVAAKVAGFDRAVFGIGDVEVHPLLFEHPRGDILVSTTKLSQFVTARYAPKDGLQAIWRWVFAWLGSGEGVPSLEWKPTVRATYARDADLPAHAAREAIIRGIDWHTDARMLMHASWADRYDGLRREGVVDPANPVGPAPDSAWPAGDGTCGVLEGVSSRIRFDGSQPIRWWLRSDSNGESSLAFALRSVIDGDRRSRRIAANLLDWIYVDSGLFKDDPDKADFGLIHWSHDSASLYGDNDIRVILGCMGTAAVLDTGRWDEALLRNILGNYRTSGVHGFREAALNGDRLLSLGWEHYWRARTVHYAPHYQAWIWASYLWLYDKTGYAPLLERTRNAIRMMMEAYPDGWRWTNGIQQERGRMLLALAWLIRVDDRPEHRAWLKRIAADMARCQDVSGAIREELGRPGGGSYRPPLSNAEYGTSEASLIQKNGDPVADLLYTCNFTFLGLHEAHAATGREEYGRMADRLAEFLVRVQVKSEDHPELDGGWFRAFDFERWDYWGSNADAGWGAWSIEVGWTQAWIPTVLALREQEQSLWDLTADSKIAVHWDETRELMLPESAFEGLEPEEVSHAAAGRPVRLAAEPDPRYAGRGSVSLTDGFLGPGDHMAPEWLGYLGENFEATIDLGAPIRIRRLGAGFLLSTRVGILLPVRVEWAVANDDGVFREVAAVTHDVAHQQQGPLVHRFSTPLEGVTARHVRVRAINVKVLPDQHPARGKRAWMFIDEVTVNRAAEDEEDRP